MANGTTVQADILWVQNLQTFETSNHLSQRWTEVYSTGVPNSHDIVKAVWQ